MVAGFPPALMLGLIVVGAGGAAFLGFNRVYAACRPTAPDATGFRRCPSPRESWRAVWTGAASRDGGIQVERATAAVRGDRGRLRGSGAAPGIGAATGYVLALLEDGTGFEIQGMPPGPAVQLWPTVRILWARCASISHEAPPQTLVRVYHGKQQADTASSLQHETDVLGRFGYQPSSQSWAQGQWGCGAWLAALVLCILLIGLLVFIYMLIVKPDGSLTVTFERRVRPPKLAARKDPGTRPTADDLGSRVEFGSRRSNGSAPVRSSRRPSTRPGGPRSSMRSDDGAHRVEFQVSCSQAQPADRRPLSASRGG